MPVIALLGIASAPKASALQRLRWWPLFNILSPAVGGERGLFIAQH